MRRNYQTPTVDTNWGALRNTSQPIAVAIHAIADSKRSPEAIWEAPTAAEMDHVTMALNEYLSNGDFEPSDDGRYFWGEETITIG